MAHHNASEAVRAATFHKYSCVPILPPYFTLIMIAFSLIIAAAYHLCGRG